MSSAGIQKLFCGIYSTFKCSFGEFVGEKVFSPSFSSAILAPPSLLSLHSSFIIISFFQISVLSAHYFYSGSIILAEPYRIVTFSFLCNIFFLLPILVIAYVFKKNFVLSFLIFHLISFVICVAISKPSANYQDGLLLLSRFSCVQLCATP